MKILEHRKLAELLLEARNGNMKAFSKIYEHTAEIQYFQIRQIVNDTEEAEDALQETYLTLYRNLNKINPPTALVAYLNRISYYISKNIKRSSNQRSRRTTTMEQVDELLPCEAPTPAERIETADTASSLRSALKNMDDRERLVLIMHYYQNMTINQISYSMGLSAATIKRIHHSAKQHLKHSLERQGLFGWTIFMPSIHRTIEGELVPMKTPALKNQAEFSGASQTAGSTLSGISAAGNAGGIAVTAAVKCTLLAVLTGTVLTGAGLAGLPSIEKISVPDEWQAAPAYAEITLENGAGIKSVVVQNPNGDSLTAQNKKNSSWSAAVPSNGNYTVVVTDALNRTVKKSFHVNRIDSAAPNAQVLSTDKREAYMRFTDTETGIDFSKLYCFDSSGKKIYPKIIDEAAGKVLFRLPAEDVTLHYEDKAGNKKEAYLRFNTPKDA